MKSFETVSHLDNFYQKFQDNMAFFRCNAHETYLYFPKNHMHARHFIAKLSWGRHSSVGVAVEISFSLFFLAAA